MILKYNYSADSAGFVTRKQDYSFTPLESLAERLSGITDINVINGIAERTLRGESERALIYKEDSWFKIQDSIQKMDIERKSLELTLKNGDSKGNPLKPEQANVITARIAELKEGTVVVKKEFYDHYTRQKMLVDEVDQTPYTIALEARKDAEAKSPYLVSFRGVKTTNTRPVVALDATVEAAIRKLLVRQKIDATVGDDKDLIADMANAVSALLKKSSGQVLTPAEQANVDKYVSRQTSIATILATDYKK